MTHRVQAGDLVRVEYLLGRHLQFFVYGLVMYADEHDVNVDATYLANVPVEFDTIIIPPDQIEPGTSGITIPHGFTRLERGESFDLELALELDALS